LSAFPAAASKSLGNAHIAYVFFFASDKAFFATCSDNLLTVPYSNKTFPLSKKDT